jgi:hypothetical protein
MHVSITLYTTEKTAKTHAQNQAVYEISIQQIGYKGIESTFLPMSLLQRFQRPGAYTETS